MVNLPRLAPDRRHDAGGQAEEESPGHAQQDAFGLLLHAGRISPREACARLIEGATQDHGRILGYGLSGDAHHATAPDQDGAGAANAIVAALKDSAVQAAEIGYVNAHGTGTEANDGAESRAISKLFGDTVPVSSTKG